jgi:hypothetical protein
MHRLDPKSILLALAVSLPAGAADPVLEKLAAPAPEELAESIRAGLAPEGFRVSVDGQSLMEFWGRKELPLKEADGGIGVSFGRIGVGTLVGAVRIGEGWSDYKKHPIQPGVYSLRYAIQPADGNHMGVSEHRDFLLLLPATEDKDLSTEFKQEDLLPLSFGATLTAHPGVLALFPVTKDPAGPELLKNDLGQWMVAVKVGSLALGLVIVGHGEVEG